MTAKPWGRHRAGQYRTDTKILAQRDYACDDQPGYGHPYSLRAARQSAALTRAGREMIRQQIIEAGVRHAG
jgi:hypothetical protein